MRHRTTRPFMATSGNRHPRDFLPARGRRFQAHFTLIALTLGAPAFANNGLNLIGFGTESTLMGGADTALARDTTSLNTNPAGLTQIRRRAFDVYSATAFALDEAYADQFGNDQNVSNNVIPVGGGGYAQRIGSTGLVAGVGFFVQGGAGAVYKNLQTPFGTRDELSALTGVVKLTPGIAYQASDAVSLGISVSAVYAQANQKVFPGTSAFNPADPAHSFFGTDLSNAHTLRYGARIGALARVSDDVSLAAVYASRVALPLHGGQLVANMSSIGLGMVTYGDAHIDGLSLPQEISLGLAWRQSPATLVSLKISRLNWADALRSLTLTVNSPNNPAAPATIQTTNALNWSNSNVFALGVRHSLNEQTAVLAGANYGPRPMPDSTLSPIFAPTGQKHLTLGFAHHLNAEYEISGGLEYQFAERIYYSNPQLPLGPVVQTRNEYVALQLMLSRRW
jgi:long-chain fatty acid transport protein